MAKKKYYVVWNGRQPGIYSTWTECEKQVKGFSGATFQSFTSETDAKAAYDNPPSTFSVEQTKQKNKKCNTSHTSSLLPDNPPDYRHDSVLQLPLEVTANAWAVDAACSGNPGSMEYRGIDLATGATVFHYGPICGTNNIGEFLAIVHALALMKQQGINKTIYSDSNIAILWINKGTCRTNLHRDTKTESLYKLIVRAETWLKSNKWNDIPLLKWQTKEWGEIPADFGRK